MDKTGPKFRRRLNEQQLAILDLLFRFRFGTTDLVACSLGKKNGIFVHKSLGNLVDQGYMAKRYEPSYKLKGQHASYYLTPKALRLLRDGKRQEDITDKVIKNSYKDKTVTEGFISRCLVLFGVYNQLVNLYPDLKLFTKQELGSFNYLPQPLPDAYIALKAKDTTKRFLLELIEDKTPSYIVDFRIRQLITYYQDQTWEITKSPFPPILCICESGTLERRLTRQITRLLYRNDCDMAFYTTTMKALLQIVKDNDKVWTSTAEPEELLRLQNTS